MANARRYVGPIDDDKAISTKQYVVEKALPTISSGDYGKVLAVKSDESGAEWVDDAPSGGVTLGKYRVQYNEELNCLEITYEED